MYSATGNGIGRDGIDDLDAATPDGVVDETLHAAGEVGDQLEPRHGRDQLSVDTGATPAGDQHVQALHVRLEFLGAAKRFRGDKAAHAGQCVQVVLSEQFVAHDRVHEQCGSGRVGHDPENTP